MRNQNKEEHLLINAHSTDVNVMTWNQRSVNLLASGDDNGQFKVWDLRYIKNEPITTIKWHSEPITGI